MGAAAAALVRPPDPLSAEEELLPLGGEVTVESFARRLARARKDSVIVICGAGISVSAGIPDFRTKGSGLYDNLQKYDLPTPESVFNLEYFREHPLPFFQLARELYPGNFAPTPAHAFLRLLQNKGVLRRCFTQNIDTLERRAGVESSRLVEAHGSFNQAHCLSCKAAHSSDWVKEEIFAGRVPVYCSECHNGLVKPDIVFFGEGLPKRFSMLRQADLPEAEFLIVMGTSLSVDPFASIVNEVNPFCPRLLINNVEVGLRDRAGHGFRFGAYDNYRDVALLSACDEGVRWLAEAAGWGEDFQDVLMAQQAEHRQEAAAPADAPHVEAHPDGMMSKRWRRRFSSELPPLTAVEGVEDSAHTLPHADKAPRIVHLEGCHQLSECRGGQTIPFRVLLGGAAAAADLGPAWLGLVPSGMSRPDRVVDRTAVVVEPAAEALEEPVAPDASAGAPQALRSTVVQLTVPPLKKKQLNRNEEVSYEVWLVRESVADNGEPEDVAVARGGPFVTVGNSESVEVANRFTRLATLSTFHNLAGSAQPQEPASAGAPDAIPDAAHGEDPGVGTDADPGNAGSRESD